MTCTSYSVDRCTGGTPSASDIFGAGYEADKAFDNSTSTRWSETGDSFPEWIKYDFGVGVTPNLAKLRVYPFEDPGDNMVRLKDFKVQYSDNDSDWFDAGTFQCANSGEQWYEFEWSSVGGHRYWRLYITTTWDGSSSSLFEIELMECLEWDEETDENFTLSDAIDAESNSEFLEEDFTLDDSIIVEKTTESSFSEDFELSDIIDAFNLTDELAEDFTFSDSIERDFEAYRESQENFELSDSIDALNWSQWFRDNAERSTKVYYLTVTGAEDGTTDIEIPMESFQARKRSGDPTYLSAVVPFSYASQISARSNGQIVVDMAYKIGAEISLREEIVRADIDDIRIDEGSRKGSISLFGYRTDSYVSQSSEVLDPIYRNVTDGKLRYRFAVPDPYLNPGDVCTVGGDQFTVGSISYVVSARQQSMEVAEA